MDAVHALVQAMIHSHLDYCNSLLAGLETDQLSRLQSVLRAAARLCSACLVVLQCQQLCMTRFIG